MDSGADACAPADFIAGSRLDLAAYELWTRCHEGGTVPSQQEILAHEDCDFVDHSVLIRIADDESTPTISHIGTQLWLGLDGMLPQDIGEVPQRSVLSRITEHYLEAVANRTAVGFEAEFVNEDGSAIGYRAIALPCSGDGRRIDAVLGVVDYSVVTEEAADNDAAPAPASRDERQTPMPKEGWRAVIAKMRRDPDEPVDDVAEASPPQDPAPVETPAGPSAKPRKRQALDPARDMAPPAPVEPQPAPAEAQSGPDIQPALAQLLYVDGALAVALVDGDSGMPLASAGDTEAIDLDVAVAGNADVLRAKRKALRALGMEERVEDIMITLPSQYHLLRPLGADARLFLCLVLDREGATLAMARHELRRVERALQI